jgi:hypothetical protein
MINLAVDFQKRFKEFYPGFEKSSGLKYRIRFLFCMLFTFGSVSSIWILTFTITDPQRFPIYLKIVYTFPKTIILYFGGLYLLGVFWIDQAVFKIKSQLELLKDTLKFYEHARTRECLYLLSELEKVSEIYSKLYEFFKAFHEIFTTPMLFVVFSCFLAIMSQCYYASLTILFPYYDHDQNIKLILTLNGILSICVNILDAINYNNACSQCMEKVIGSLAYFSTSFHLFILFVRPLQYLLNCMI